MASPRLKLAYLSLRGLALRTQRSRPRGARRGAPRRFLIVNLPRLGDVALSSGAIRALAKSVLRAEIVVSAPKALHPILESLPGVIACIEHPDRSLRSARQILRALPNALPADWRPDVGIDLSLDWPLATSWLVRGSGAARSFGFDVAGRGPLFDFSVEPGEREHVLSSMRRLLTLVLNEDPGELLPALPKSAQPLRHSKPRIVIHPGATALTQRWQPEKFAQAALQLAEESGAEVVVVGSRNEQELLERFQRSFGRNCRSVIVNDVRGLSREIEQADLLLCNNSGPLHLASALGTPTVSTRGPTVIERFAPVGPRQSVVNADLDCLGCNQNRCPRGDYACMNQLEPERVARAARSLLRESR